MQLSHDDLGDALKAVANVLGHVAPIFIMADPGDIIALPMVRSPFTDLPTIYIYERYPGGVGYSEKLFHAHQQIVSEAITLIENCACPAGCPSCVGPELEVGEKGKTSAIALLKLGTLPA